MQLSYIAFVSFVSGVLSAPVVLLPRQAESSVFFCDGIDFNLDCQTTTVPLNTCVNLPDSYNDRISSFRSGENTVCLLWDAINCQGNNPGYIGSVGSSDLREQNFNDVTSSFQCKEA